jgi:hypothetical protein
VERGNESVEQCSSQSASVGPGATSYRWPQLYVDEGSGAHPMTRQEFFTIQQAALNHQPLPAGWHFYLRQNTEVPAEPGSNLNSFTDSSYLDSQVIN